jgi:DNA-binding LacI/PurR family transcriptional regulator
VMSIRPTEDEVEALRRERLPVVLVDVRHPDLPRVVIDDVLGGQMATEHLLAKGHTKIGFVGDEPTPFGFTSSEQRRQGMAKALRRAGIKRRDAYEQRGAHGREPARELAQRLLLLADPPTAIFAASDVQAMGVLAAARAKRLRVPEDLAVIGFDDIEVADVLGLSTVHQPLHETGARGTELLLAAIDGAGAAPIEERAPLTVVERRTT